MTMTDAKTDAMKDRDKRYGEFDVVDTDYRMTHLHVIEVPASIAKPIKARRLTNGSFTVGSFEWSPDGKSIAFDHRKDPNAASGGTADISVVSVSDGSVRPLVAQDGPDSNPKWSPDGKQIAFQSAMKNPWFFFTNSRIAIVSADGRTDSIGHRSVRRAARPDRLGPGWDLLPGTREDYRPDVPAESGDGRVRCDHQIIR